jgi:hypothetical protein
MNWLKTFVDSLFLGGNRYRQRQFLMRKDLTVDATARSLAGATCRSRGVVELGDKRSNRIHTTF